MTINKLWVKVVFIFSAVLLAMLNFQQCSDVNISRVMFSSDFESKGFPFRLYPPTDYLAQHRYVIMIDMTNSMISGPCPFDVGNEPTFHTNSVYYEYDPNKPILNDINDGRAAGRDCVVDPNLPIESGSEWLPDPYSPSLQYKTHLGSDYRAYRLDLVDKWLDDLTKSLTDESLARVRVLLVPVSGGRSQAAIDKNNPLGREFVKLDDQRLSQSLKYLRDEHKRNLSLVKDESDHSRWQKTNFGTTAPGQIFKELHPVLDADMKALNEQGELNFATYDIIYLGDGKVVPQKEHLEDTLKINRFCNGAQTAGFCTEVMDALKEAWGDPELNSVEAIDLRLSMLQTLPQYYGSGLVNVSFLRVHPTESLPEEDEETLFDLLVSAAKNRFAAIEKWDVPYGGTPLNLLPVDGSVKTYKMTHLYVYNPNARVDKNGSLQVDSDGDGLFDHEEEEFGLDPLKRRSNGFCLDSFAAKESFKDRCRAFAVGHSCDPSLDTDIDGLNQCEEILLGTDPFDFDTDGDSIPDSLEWLYGYNPLKSDKSSDTSGDGIPNLVNFSAGLSGKHYFDQVSKDYRAKYSVDFKGYEQIEDIQLKKVQIELFDVSLLNIPVLPLKVVSDNQRIESYMGRVNGDGSNRELLRIPKAFELLSSSSELQLNKIVALARIIDPRFPKMVYWRIMKFSVSEGFGWSRKKVDLSSFQLIPMIDKNLAAESIE